MFDGFEMGLFPLVGRPALKDLLGESGQAHVDVWFGLMIAGFLVGAASGGVLFGWLGDRLGRVRAMTLSVLTYAVFMGLCGIADSPAKVFRVPLHFVAGDGGRMVAGRGPGDGDLARQVAGHAGRPDRGGLQRRLSVDCPGGPGLGAIYRRHAAAAVGHGAAKGLGRPACVPLRLAADDADRGGAGAAHVFHPAFGSRIAPLGARETAGLDLVLVGPRFVGRGGRHGGAAGDDRAVAARDGTTRWPCGSAGRSSGWPWRSWDSSFPCSAISSGQGPRRRNSPCRRGRRCGGCCWGPA